MLIPDDPHGQDLLDRDRFAFQIANEVLTYMKVNTSSLVFGIHGPWGSGKSVFIQLVRKHLNAEIANLEEPPRRWWQRFFPLKPKQRHLIVEFNPWAFSGSADLQAVFLKELANKIGRWWVKGRRQLSRLAQKFIWVDNFGGRGVVTGLSRIVDVSIDQMKDSLNKTILKSQRKLIVIMDDIDRLRPSEILTVLQLVKMNANFANTVFFIAFDKDVVCHAIEQEYGYKDGEGYLEKMIQVDYSLPAILPENLEAIFFDRLQQFIRVNEIDLDIKAITFLWLIDGLHDYFRKIRDIHRFFNALSIRSSTIYRDVDFKEFMLVEVIRIFDNHSYETIKHNYKEGRRTTGSSKYNEQLGKVRKGRSGFLYDILFEKTGPKKDRQFDIADPAFFDRYFSMSVSKKDLRQEEFETFVDQPEIRARLIVQLISTRKIDYLLRRMTVKQRLVNAPNKSQMMSVLLSPWIRKDAELVPYWTQLWEALKSISMSYEDVNEGFGELIDNIDMNDSEFNPARFIFRWILLENIDESVLILDNDLQSIKALLQSRKYILERNYNQLLLNYKNLFFFGDAFHELYSRLFITSFAKYRLTEYPEEFRGLISDNKRIFRILDILVKRDSTSRKPIAVDSIYFDRLLPGSLKEEFLDKLKNFDTRGLPATDKATVELYLTFLSAEIRGYQN